VVKAKKVLQAQRKKKKKSSQEMKEDFSWGFQFEKKGLFVPV